MFRVDAGTLAGHSGRFDVTASELTSDGEAVAAALRDAMGAAGDPEVQGAVAHALASLEASLEAVVAQVAAIGPALTQTAANYCTADQSSARGFTP